MWHGCVEVPSSAPAKGHVGISPNSSRWETRSVFLDEIEQHVPVEVRRNRPGAAAGTPPPNRVVETLKPQPVKQVLVDISQAGDRSLLKEVLQREGSGGDSEEGRVLQGSSVLVSIVAVDANADTALADRILHGPKEHSWVLGTGNRCELVELAVASMQVGERCTVTSKDPLIYADSGLGISTADGREVEYCFHLREASCNDCRSEPAAFFEWAATQKVAGGERLKEGKVQLALLKYRQIDKELESIRRSTEGWSSDDVESAKELSRTLHLNCSVCLLRLKCWAAAWKECNLVLAEDSSNLKALYRRGQAQFRLGDAAAAIRDFEAVVDMDPSNWEATRQIDQCRRSLERAKDKDEYLSERKGHAITAKWG